ncbi:MAG: hypothetical protein PHX62_08055 [Bacilli bacterium]|nr:hypothetical protein [Bacilli bacterium]
MLTKVEKINDLLDKKNTNSKNYLYSQIIKNERLKRHMTLEEMSKGICSISYLCKVEKNAIEPEESYIQAIFERVNLDYEKVGKNILEDGIRNLLKCYLYGNYEGITDLYNQIDDSIFNAYNYMIKGLYHLIKKDYREFQKVMRSLDKIKDTLLRDDIGVMLFLVVEYYCQTFQFYEAYNHLKYLNNRDFEYLELNWLILEQHYYVGVNLGNFPMAMKHYILLMKNMNIGYPSKRQVMVRLMLLSLKSSEYFHEVEKELENLRMGTDDYAHYLDVYYWKLIIYIKGKNYLKVYDKIIEENLLDDIRFIALLLYVADNINDDSYKENAVEIAEKFDYTDNDTFHYKFIRFMILKITANKQHQVIDFLKYNVLPGRNTYYHHLYTQVYEDYYLNYLCKSSKYKEAVAFVSRQLFRYRG